MTLTHDQQHALEVFKSNENILLLGDPGTGKSALIHEMIQCANSQNWRIAVTASTGIAAQLLSGNTIHSFLKAFPGMSLQDIDYASKVEHLNKVDILFIDEVSMLGDTFIDYLWNCYYSANHPIQLVLAGDFFQLPPVHANYAFRSNCWNRFGLNSIFLKEVVRQDNAEFIKNLELLKYGDRGCLSYLMKNSSKERFSNQITICARNKEANAINAREVSMLNSPGKIYPALYDGKITKSDLIVEENLLLKCGMRVMTLTNDKDYRNGSFGTIVEMNDKAVRVQFDNGAEVQLSRYPFTVPRIDISGEYTKYYQFPLRPAYATTIHKSQGQTFEKVNIDGSHCWSPGQLYVAVSRAKSIDGICFTSPISPRNIKTDPEVIKFYESLCA